MDTNKLIKDNPNLTGPEFMDLLTREIMTDVYADTLCKNIDKGMTPGDAADAADITLLSVLSTDPLEGLE